MCIRDRIAFCIALNYIALHRFISRHLAGFITYLGDSRDVSPLEAKIGEDLVLCPNVLAYFDALVALAPWDNNAKEGERATKIVTRVQDLQEEHNGAAAKEALKEVVSRV